MSIEFVKFNRIPMYNKIVKQYQRKGNIAIGCNHYSTANCKVSMIENISSWLNSTIITDTEKKDFLNEVFIDTKSQFYFMTLIYKNAVDFLRKHFNVIYAIQVPIGYRDEMQYHVLVMNEAFCCNEYKERIKREGIKKLESKIK